MLPERGHTLRPPPFGCILAFTGNFLKSTTGTIDILSILATFSFTDVVDPKGWLCGFPFSTSSSE
jgi:hypothetical protein